MLGFFSKLARAPWWIFAVLAAVAGYFGFVAGGFSVGGYEPKPLAMLVTAIPQLEPAISWLESMGFDRNQGVGLPFGAGGSAAGMPLGIDTSPSVASRIQIFAGFFALIAIYKLFFGASKPSRKAGSVLDDPRVMQAILKDAPGKISDEAWANPKQAVAQQAAGAGSEAASLRIGKRADPAVSKRTAPTDTQTGRSKELLKRAKPQRESRAERRAREEMVRNKLKGDPFEKLLHDSV